MQSKSFISRVLRHRFVCGATVALLAQAIIARGEPKSDEPKPDESSAQQILERMAKAYADCKTYHDSGTVKTLFVQSTGNRTVEKPFKTAFVRPDQLRFEYKDENAGRYIIWSKAAEVQTWWDVQPGIKKPGSLNLALATATGVSGSSAHTIPRLLLPDAVSGRSLTEITEAKRGDDGNLDKVDCFRIDGKYANHPITLWIAKDSYLVRRIDQQAKFDKFRTETTTTYDPAFDEQITDEMLEFDPPK